MARRAATSFLLFAALSAIVVRAQQQNAPTAPVAPATLPPPLTEYMGRRIAPAMSWEAGPWLTRIEREKEERCAELLRALDLKPGQVVADVGCGNGFYTFKLAELVGPKGKVYAVDVQPEMLELLKKEGARLGPERMKNVEPLLGTIVDPKLPERSVDLAFLVDTYHELARPEEMLAALAKSLTPKGRVVLVEFRLEDPNVPIKLLHKMSKEQMKKELAANGFEVESEYDQLPWQHVVFFRASAKAKTNAAPGANPAAGAPADPPKKQEHGEKPKDGRDDANEPRAAQEDAAAASRPPQPRESDRLATAASSK